MRRFLIATLFLVPLVTFAQRERGEIRAGNKQYKAGDYKGAEVKYRSALQSNGDSYEAMSNLGSALFKQKLSGDAQSIFQKVVERGDKLTPAQMAGATYNLGNSYLQERKLDEAIESYKSALRINPKDEVARFNLAYAQKLKQNDNGGGGGQQPKPDPQNEPDNQDKDKQDKDKEQQEQPKPESRQDAERILKALQDAENKTKEKVDKSKPQEGTSRSTKQW